MASGSAIILFFVSDIAHNLRSPIMSIAGGLAALKDLVKEYGESVDNDHGTREEPP